MKLGTSVVLVLAALAGRASADASGDTKLGRLQYVHDDAGRAPAKLERAAVTALLTKGRWTPQWKDSKHGDRAARGLPRLSFVSKAPPHYGDIGGERYVVIRALEQRGAAIIVVIDGRAFEIVACDIDPDRTCLVAATMPTSVACSDRRWRMVELAAHEQKLAKLEADLASARLMSA